MLQAFVVTLREGLEAFLIVAISLAYLKKTGRSALVPAVRWGIVASVLLSIGAGLLLAKAANQSLWEGVLALVAAVLVATLTVHMWRAGRYMKRDIEGRLEASSTRAGGAAFFGVFMFTLLMITREGMETALLMNALLFTVQSPQIVSGAIGGTILAVSMRGKLTAEPAVKGTPTSLPAEPSAAWPVVASSPVPPAIDPAPTIMTASRNINRMIAGHGAPNAIRSPISKRRLLAA